jgi:hypothetical protein
MEKLKAYIDTDANQFALLMEHQFRAIQNSVAPLAQLEEVLAIMRVFDGCQTEMIVLYHNLIIDAVEQATKSWSRIDEANKKRAQTIYNQITAIGTKLERLVQSIKSRKPIVGQLSADTSLFDQPAKDAGHFPVNKK